MKQTSFQWAGTQKTTEQILPELEEKRCWWNCRMMSRIDEVGAWKQTVALIELFSCVWTKSATVLWQIIFCFCPTYQTFWHGWIMFGNESKMARTKWWGSVLITNCGHWLHKPQIRITNLKTQIETTFTNTKNKATRSFSFWWLRYNHPSKAHTWTGEKNTAEE